MGLLNPTSVTSNRICLLPVAQQVIGALMLHKLISLLFHNFAYKSVVSEKHREEARFDAEIAGLREVYNTHVAEKTRLEGMKVLATTDATKKPLQTLIDIRQNAIDTQQGLIDQAQARKDQHMVPFERKVAHVKSQCDEDKTYLVFAAKRMAPIYASYVSWKQLNLQKAAAAA